MDILALLFQEFIWFDWSTSQLSIKLFNYFFFQRTVQNFVDSSKCFSWLDWTTAILLESPGFYGMVVFSRGTTWINFRWFFIDPPLWMVQAFWLYLFVMGLHSVSQQLSRKVKISVDGITQSWWKDGLKPWYTKRRDRVVTFKCFPGWSANSIAGPMREELC